MTFPGGLLNDPRLRQRPDASRVQYGPGDQGLLQMGGEIAKSVGSAGARIAPAIWNAVKADPRGAAGTVAKELTGYEDLTQRLPEAFRNRDLGGMGMAALSALPIVGAIADGRRGMTAAQRIMAQLKDIEAAGGRTLTREGVDLAAKAGYQVGVGTKVKPIKQVTEAAIEKALAQVKPGEHFGMWKEGGKWYIEPSVLVDDFDQAVQSAVDGKQLAIWDHGKGENVRLLRHHSGAENLTELDPRFAGTGSLRGAERKRTKAPKGVHFYDPATPAERELADLPAYFTPVPDNRIVQLGAPRSTWPQEVQDLLKGFKDSDDMERRLQKAGYLYRTDYHTLGRDDVPGIIKGFDKYPVWAPGRPRPSAKAPAPKAAAVSLPPGFDREIIKQGGLLSANKIDKMYGGQVLPSDVTGLFPKPSPGELPPVAQFDIPRPQPGTAKTQALAAELETEVAKGLIDSPRVQELVATRPELKDWYESMQSMRKSFYDEFPDPADAEARFRKYVRFNTAQSPNTPVPRQIRQATYDHYQDGQGLLQGRLDARGRGVEPGFSPLFPASAAPQTQMVVDNVPFNGPKVGSFDENNFGNKIPFTGDTHASTDTRRALEHRPDLQGLIPVKGSLPDDWKYGAVEKGWQAAGKEYGMTASELQALTWVGNGDINGLKSGVEPALELYARRVVMTAKHMAKIAGMPELDSPEGFKAIWKAVQNKEIPLLGIGGAAAVGTATQKAPSQESGRGPRGLL